MTARDQRPTDRGARSTDTRGVPVQIDQAEGRQCLLAGGDSGDPARPSAQSAHQVTFDPATQRNVTAVLGKAAYLVCRVNNIGNQTVSWIRHRDLAILSAGQQTYARDGRMALYHQPGSREWVLKIKFVQLRDMGVYGCQLPTTPIISLPIQLNVVVPQTEILGEKEIFVNMGSTINLTCTVLHSHSDFIFWYHNDSVVHHSASQEERVAVRTERDSATNSYLLIQGARPPDSGLYTCSPSDAQSASVNVHVLRGEKPAAMQTNAAGSHLMLGMVMLALLTAALQLNCH